MDSICVIGLGYIGLPTASLFANNGFRVLGVDTSTKVVETINSAEIHIDEAGLRTLVEAGIRSGQLKASCEPAPSDVFIIAVPTPFGPEKRPDLSHVFAATRSILPHLRSGNLVVMESTVPPGTTERVASYIAEHRKDLVDRHKEYPQSLRFLTAHCPERVLPGRILKELVDNDRVVGGLTREASVRAAELYGRIVSGKIYQTDATTAEMVKLSENTFRDINIAFSNELALIAEKSGVNVWDIIELANKHPRVNILRPGPGVGGHCIAVDPWFIVAEFPEESEIIRAARLRNDAIPRHVVDRIVGLIANEENPKIACLGAAYKGNVGDGRNSPAVEIYEMLLSKFSGRGEVALTDSHLGESKLPLRTVDDVLEGATILVLLADHNEYKQLDPVLVAKKVRKKILLDTRNHLDKKRWVAAGFEVHVLGDGTSMHPKGLSAAWPTGV